MRPRLSTATPFRPAAVAHHRNAHRDDDGTAGAAATPRLGLAVLALSVAAVVAVAAAPLRFSVGGQVARVQSGTLEVAFDHPVATSLILADARLHGARAEVAVGIGATNATVGDHLRVSVPPGSAFAAGEPVTLTFRTSFLRLILAHGAVRS